MQCFDGIHLRVDANFRLCFLAWWKLKVLMNFLKKHDMVVGGFW